MNALHAFQCDHWAPLVFLSYTISVLGSYCALQWAGQIPLTRGWLRGGWVAGAAVAMGGGGIWSMHFIAMISCRLPVPVSYDVTVTLASLVVAIAVTGIGLYTVGVEVSSVGRLLAGGIFTGLGVAAMHYTGMAAMRLPARTTYLPVLVAASILIAVVAATAALWIAFNMRGRLQRILSSLVMGVAVCGMHYTAMAAATFVPTGSATAARQLVLRANDLGFMVFGITVVVLALLFLVSRVVKRKQVAEAVRRARELERQVAERTAELAKANEELHTEIVERRRVEAALKRQHEEMRERTNYLNTLIENSPIAIVVLDSARRVQMVNSAFEELFLYRQSEVVGADLDDFICPPGEPGASEGADLTRRVASGQVVHVTTVRRRKGGKTVDVELYGVPLMDEDRLIGIYGLYNDITERRHLEEQLRQSQKMEAIGTLAGGVAHDFNNLLTTILGYGELLLQAVKPNDSMRDGIEEILKAGKRAASLTRQLLAFSRKQLVEPKILDLGAIVADMDKMIRRLVGEDIELISVASPQLGRVRADRGQIEQTLMNLVVNARDAMPRGGKLRIEAGNAELKGGATGERFQVDPGLYVMLAVSDTGVGMDGETRDRIFEPFFTTKETGQGTGLGLSTVYGIVKQNGGYIWVYSQPGQGSTFKIYLPRVDQEITRVEAPEMPRPSGGKETILLVEDEKAVRQLAKITLTRQGYNVLEAGNGEEAVRVVAETGQGIDLVLTDGVMPGMSVGDLVAAIRSMLPRVKMMLVSGYTSETIVQRGMLESGMPFLAKPFTGTGLLRKVREVLDAR